MKLPNLYLTLAIVAANVLGVAPEVLAGSPPVAQTAVGSLGARSADDAVALSAADSEIVGLALSGDAAGKPFMIVDKGRARVFIFSAAGEMQGSTSALLGSAIGDDSAPGVGDRPLAQISPAERTTPAGRFPAAFGSNLAGNPVLWVDYKAAIALHSVAITNPREHRVQRLATPSWIDKRMSYGCINVPAKFFDTLVTGLFSKQGGIVYILPEVRPLEEVFTGLRSSAGDVAAGS